MKPLRSLAVLVTAVGLVCAPSVAAVAAPTAATAPIHASASTVSCKIKNGYVRTYYDGCVHWTKYACVALHHFNIKPPNYVSDGCLQAVDLWTGPNETGHAICIPGQHASGFLHTKYHSFEITGGGTC